MQTSLTVQPWLTLYFHDDFYHVVPLDALETRTQHLDAEAAVAGGGQPVLEQQQTRLGEFVQLLDSAQSTMISVASTWSSRVLDTQYCVGSGSGALLTFSCDSPAAPPISSSLRPLPVLTPITSLLL